MSKHLLRNVYLLAFATLGLSLILAYFFRNLGIYEWDYDPILFMALITPLVIITALAVVIRKLPVSLIILLASTAILTNAVFMAHMLYTYNLGHMTIAVVIAIAIFIGITLSPGMENQRLTKPAIGAIIVLLADLFALYLNISLEFDEDSFTLGAIAVAATLVLGLFTVKNIKLSSQNSELGERPSISFFLTSSLLIYLQLIFVFIVLLFINGH